MEPSALRRARPRARARRRAAAAGARRSAKLVAPVVVAPRRSAGRRRAGSRRERVGAEEGVLAAVALVPAQRRASRGTARQYEETNGTSRGSPRGRYGVSTWRCATQPQAVAGAKRPGAADDRARELVERARQRRRPSPAPARRPRRGRRRRRRVASSQPRFRAPPAKRPAAGRDDPRARCARDRGRLVGRAVVDDDHLGGRRVLRRRARRAPRRACARRSAPG